MPSNYSSTRSNRARAIVRAQLPAPCFRCGGIVTDQMQWHADHTTPRAFAEAAGLRQDQVDAAHSLAPAHASCNMRANERPSHKTKAERVAARIPKFQRPTFDNSKSDGVFSETHQNPAACSTSFLSDDAEEAQNER